MTIKCLYRTVFFLMAIMITGRAMAEQSVQLKVTGKVIPGSCTPVLSSGGTAKFGDIHDISLDLNTYTVLPAHSRLNLSVTCSSTARVGFLFKDERADSMVLPTGKTVGYILAGEDTAAQYYGLGHANGKKIGAYTITLNSVQLDGKSSTLGLSSADGGGAWGHSGVEPNGSLHGVKNDGTLYAAGAISVNSPASLTWFKNFTAGVDVYVAINKTSELDMASEIVLDGLTTLELRYL